jgi:hypothetical protein
MQLIIKSVLCFLVLLTSNGYCDPPYFSIVNSGTFGQSDVYVLVNDLSFPPPESYGALNIPTPNYTVDSISRSITVAGGSASSAIGADEQAATSITGIIQLENAAATYLNTDVVSKGLANYHVYDPNDYSNTAQDCEIFLKIVASGHFDYAIGSFYCNIYLDGLLIGILKHDGEGNAWLEGNGVHIPSYYDAGTIEYISEDPEEIGSPIIESTIGILVDQYIEDVPLGSTITIDCGASAFTNEFDADGACSFYVWMIGLGIY